MILIDASVKRPVFATMLIMALVVFGLFAYPSMGVDLYPEVEFPVITANVVYPGADPETMERKVAEPIEEAIQTMSGIRRITSRNLESVSLIIVEMELDVDGDAALQEVRDKIASVERNMPTGIEAPVVQKFNTGGSPIMAISLSSEIPPQKLTRIADKQVKQRLSQIPGVGSVTIIGGRERQVQVLVDPARMSAFGLGVGDVSQAIVAQHLNVPAGIIERGDQEITVTTKGEAQSVAEIGDIIISGMGGSPIRVRDVAVVQEGIADERSASVVDGQTAVTLQIIKQSGANAVRLADEVQEAIDDLTPRLKEQSVTLSVPMDNTVFIRRSISDVQGDLILGAILTIAIIFIFLHDIRATLVSAVAIPTSVIGSVALMYWLGFTFNYMTMLALSLAIGILVDDAIIVVENIYRHLEMGKTPMRAALDGTNEISFAVIATTLSLFAVFVPVAFMSGVVGRFFFQFGMTVTVSVLISMLVSFTLTPMLSGRLLRVSHHKSLLARMWDAGMDALERIYAVVIHGALRFPLVTMLAGAGVIAGAVVLTGMIKSEFVPPEDRSEFSVVVETPTGTSLQRTRESVVAIADDIREHLPGVRTTLATVSGGASGQSNLGKVRVALIPSRQREFSQQEAMAWIRDRTKAFPGALISVEELDPMGSDFRTQPIQFALGGNDLHELERISDAIASELKAKKGFVDVDTTLRTGKPELQVRVDRQKAADMGVPLVTIATTIRALMSEDSVATLAQDGDLYDIVVRLPESERNVLDRFENLKVRSVSGQLVELSTLVNLEMGDGASTIERFNRQRMAVVVAQLDGLQLSDGQKFVEEIAKRHLTPGISTTWLGDAEMMNDTATAMVTVIFLAAILVYMILAAQFDSFTQPIVIMVSLPLASVGAIGGLYLANMTLNIFSFIGIVMLMGLVTKAAILLVDRTNQLRDEGMETIAALEAAGRSRLRPILMTVASTVIGMVPIALALSEGGEVRAPMAVCVIGGMLASTLLTLIFIPTVYLLNDRLLNLLRITQRRHGQEAL